MESPVLHLELSSKCSLRCPECARTKYLERIRPTEMPLAVVENIRKSGKIFREINLCGDHGDPIYHSQFHNILKVLKTFAGSPLISIATNGSYRTSEWWKETALLLERQDEVIFGLDGLSDTLPLYRVNADWNSIMQGIQTLKSNSRVRIVWQWILFKHNEHQLQEAGKLARQLKVDQFLILKSSRYSEDGSTTPSSSIRVAEQEFRRGYDLSAM